MSDSTFSNLVSGGFSNFDMATPVQKMEETAQKLASQQMVNGFSNLTSGVSIFNGNNGVSNFISKQTNTSIFGIQTPSTGAASAQNLDTSVTTSSTGLKVIITAEPNINNSVVIFDVTPTISEARSSQYDSFTPIQHPGEILKYKGTSSRSWSISGTLIARNTAEATKNLSTVNIIRTWVMPFYGYGTQQTHKDLLGSPPPILTLTAYGDNLIGPVKCVLDNYDISWPNDVDYIPAYDPSSKKTKPFPVILSVTLSLKEAWSPSEYSGFSIDQYRLGNMPLAFQKAPATSTTVGSNSATPPSDPNEIAKNNHEFNTKSLDADNARIASIKSQSTSVTQSQINSSQNTSPSSTPDLDPLYVAGLKQIL